MLTDLPMMAVLHAGCAAIYLALVALISVRAATSRTGLWLAFACALTAAWAIAVAWSWRDPFEPAVGLLELARSIGWYCFVLHLYRRSISKDRQLSQAFATMGLLAVLLIGAMPLLDVMTGSGGGLSVWSIAVGARLGLAVCNILLLENLYLNTPPDLRWHVNLLCVAIGGVFLYDLVLYSDAVLFRRISVQLFEGRATVTAIAAPLIAAAAARNRRWKLDIHVSRTVVFHSATLVASGLFLLALAITGEVFREKGAEWGVVAEATLIFGGIMTIAVLLTSGSMRARLRTLVVDNFYSHRYDYRREWARCIAALSGPDSYGAAATAYTGLQTRAIRTIAAVVDSPAGALFVRDPEDVAFQWAGSWNMPAVSVPIPPTDRVVALFDGGERIAYLDQREALAPQETEADKLVPDWLASLPKLWIAVPLSHVGRLVGFVALAPSRINFKLDPEVFDLLRIVGQEVAVHIVEQRARQVIAQNKQIGEYSKRFAFVVHDIKNVSGQLSMLLSNAEHHADNPEFQRDMLVTVRSSVARISNLLSKLQSRDRSADLRMFVPAERLEPILGMVRRTRGVSVRVENDGLGASVSMDPASFDAIVLHLLDNAIEASGPERPIWMRVRHEALTVLIDIVDQGPGMTAEFIRDRLFAPFASTKDGGHGIGVFQARELLREAGGDLMVISRPGAGTTMRLLMPAAAVAVAEPSSVTA
jgi:putative PEP-CTERM system histidine kinase